MRWCAGALAALVLAGCAALSSREAALSAARQYFESPEGTVVPAGIVREEPVKILDESAKGVHSYLIPLKAEGLYVGLGEYLVAERQFSVIHFDYPRSAWVRTTVDEVRKWAAESVAKDGPFKGTTVDGPFMLYKEPRGYSWGVRFIRGGQPVKYSGSTVVIVSKIF